MPRCDPLAHPNTLDVPDRKFFRECQPAMKPSELEKSMSQLLAGMGCGMVEPPAKSLRPKFPEWLLPQIFRNAVRASNLIRNSQPG
jgi:hypothetical protein